MNLFFGALGGVENRLSVVDIAFLGGVNDESSLIGLIVSPEPVRKEKLSLKPNYVSFVIDVAILNRDLLAMKRMVKPVKFKRVEAAVRGFHVYRQRITSTNEIDRVNTSIKSERVRPELISHMRPIGILFWPRIAINDRLTFDYGRSVASVVNKCLNKYPRANPAALPWLCIDIGVEFKLDVGPFGTSGRFKSFLSGIGGSLGGSKFATLSPKGHYEKIKSKRPYKYLYNGKSNNRVSCPPHAFLCRNVRMIDSRYQGYFITFIFLLGAFCLPASFAAAVRLEGGFLSILVLVFGLYFGIFSIIGLITGGF